MIAVKGVGEFPKTAQWRTLDSSTIEVDGNKTLKFNETFTSFTGSSPLTSEITGVRKDSSSLTSVVSTTTTGPATVPPDRGTAPSPIAYKPDQSPIEILKEQGPNVSAWVSSTLDTPIPEAIWENLTFLKEALRDEVAAKPKASSIAYSYALRLCALMIDDLAERKVVLTKAGGDAVLHQSSQLTESRRDHLTWPMYALERDERGDRKQWAAKHTGEMVDWAKRTNEMRYDLGVWYDKFREALRKGPQPK